MLCWTGFGQTRNAARQPRKAAKKIAAPRPVDESRLERRLRKQNAKKASNLPAQYSSVYDIRNFTKFEILAESNDPKKSGAAIVKVLSAERSVRLVGETEEAQFYIKYTETADKASMEVYYFNYGKRIVVWAEERNAAGAETELTEEFLKVLQRNKKLDDQDEPVADAR